MADNVAITPGSGATIATDDVGGVQYQRVKFDVGGDGAASPLVRGQQAKANSLPVALASDQDALPVTDNGGSLTVDGAVELGAATLAALETIGVGSIAAGDNNIGNVDLASAIPAGNNNIGDVDVLTVNAQSAHDAAVAGNPVRIAGRAESTELTAVADGDTCDLMTDLNGKLVVAPYAVPERLVSGVTAAIATATNTSVIAAGGAGVRNYVTAVLVTNSHASQGVLVTITDGAGGTALYRGYAAPGGGGFAADLPAPLRGTANTAIFVTTDAAGSVYVSAAGYRAP